MAGMVSMNCPTNCSMVSSLHEEVACTAVAHRKALNCQHAPGGSEDASSVASSVGVTSTSAASNHSSPSPGTRSGGGLPQKLFELAAVAVAPTRAGGGPTTGRWMLAGGALGGRGVRGGVGGVSGDGTAAPPPLSKAASHAAPSPAAGSSGGDGGGSFARSRAPAPGGGGGVAGLPARATRTTIGCTTIGCTTIGRAAVGGVARRGGGAGGALATGGVGCRVVGPLGPGAVSGVVGELGCMAAPRVVGAGAEPNREANASMNERPCPCSSSVSGPPAGGGSRSSSLTAGDSGRARPSHRVETGWSKSANGLEGARGIRSSSWP